MKKIASLPSIAALLVVAAFSSAHAQDSASKRIDNGLGTALVINVQNVNQFSDIAWHRTMAPEFFEKEYPHGSPYFSREWLPGVVELSSHRVIPQSHEVLVFNYDKMRFRVMTSTLDGKVRSYSIDSVSKFALVDSNSRIYQFEKVPAISSSYFLMPLVKSERGYSLYKRLITKMKEADYHNEGYNTSTGKRYDAFIDDYEYYLVAAGSKPVKFYLSQKHLAKVFKAQPQKLNTIDQKYDHKVPEEGLVELVQQLNEDHQYL